MTIDDVCRCGRPHGGGEEQSASCGQGREGLKVTKFLWTSFMELTYSEPQWTKQQCIWFVNPHSWIIWRRTIYQVSSSIQCSFKISDV